MTTYTDKYIKKLKTIEQHNKEKREFYSDNGTGIECPDCGAELIEPNPGIMLACNPPKKAVNCPACAYRSYIIA